MNRLSADWLTQKHESNWSRDYAFGQPLPLRLHRAISWIRRAESSSNDCDVEFICYWIAFNAAYGEDAPDLAYKQNEVTAFNRFLEDILDQDDGNEIQQVIFVDLQPAVHSLLANKFVYEPFWKNLNGVSGYNNWESDFSQSKIRVDRAFQSRNCQTILTAIFFRLYTLRNQLMHGGATWQSSLNRDQVRDGADIMRAMVPLCVSLMLDSSDSAFWGKPYYPPISDSAT